MSPTTDLLSDFVALIERIIPIQVDPASITESTTLASDLMLDSISLVSLLALCEELFEISLADQTDKIVGIQTVGDALSLIVSLRTAEA